jgi:hypothetical protein
MTPAEPVRLARAVYLIGNPSQPLDVDSLRLAARRLNVLTHDSRGRQALDLPVIEKFREPRGARSFAEMEIAK